MLLLQTASQVMQNTFQFRIIIIIILKEPLLLFLMNLECFKNLNMQ